MWYYRGGKRLDYCHLLQFISDSTIDEAHYERDISYAEFYNYFEDHMPQKHLPRQSQVNKSAKAYCKAHHIDPFPQDLITDKKRGTIKRNNVQYFHFRRMTCENDG